MGGNYERLQAAAKETYGLDVNGAVRVASGLDLDVNGVAQALWGTDWHGAFDELLFMLSNHALLLDGQSGSYASTPDAASLDITGDLSLRCEFVATAGGNYHLVSKWVTSTANRSYRLYRSATFGTLHIESSPDGTTEQSAFAVASVPRALRGDVDVDDGAGNRVYTVYGADEIDGTWTELNSSTTAGTTSVFASSAALEVGSANSGASLPFTGRITRVEVYNSAGTLVADPDFRNLEPGTTSFSDGVGNTWTVHGTAEVV